MASVESEKLVEKREATVEPAEEMVSSLTDGRVAEPVARGASLTALTVKETLWMARVLTLGSVPEPLSITSKVMVAVPLALATVLYCRAAKSAALSVVLAVTGVEPLLIKSIMKDGIAVIV